MKWDGNFERRLSLSQLKQIAGRAGRYGLGDNSTAGIATTLRDEDLPVLRRALVTVLPPKMSQAVLPIDMDRIGQLQTILGSSSLADTFEIMEYAGKTSPLFTQATSQLQKRDVTDFLDTQCGDLSLNEKCVIGMAPVSWADEPSKHTLTKQHSPLFIGFKIG